MSDLVEHARRELALCGQTAEDPAYAQSIISAIAALAAWDGHSGGSMAAAVDQVGRLLRFQTLTPLTNHPGEWFNHGIMSGTPLWQSLRDPSAFSDDAGRTHWFVDERDPPAPDGGRTVHLTTPARPS